MLPEAAKGRTSSIKTLSLDVNLHYELNLGTTVGPNAYIGSFSLKQMVVGFSEKCYSTEEVPKSPKPFKDLRI